MKHLKTYKLFEKRGFWRRLSKTKPFITPESFEDVVEDRLIELRDLGYHITIQRAFKYYGVLITSVEIVVTENLMDNLLSMTSELKESGYKFSQCKVRFNKPYAKEYEEVDSIESLRDLSPEPKVDDCGRDLTKVMNILLLYKKI